MLDMTESIAPKSDQINADDLMGGPRTVTITDVRRGSADQPIEVVTDFFGPGRPWRPSKTDRRVLVAAWGLDGSSYVGRRITIYRDPTVKWAGEAVGGIRIQAMSHIGKTLKLAMTVTRGKKAPYVVEPLPDTPPPAATAPDNLPRLFEVMKAAGFGKDDAPAYLSRVVGREVAGSKELTADEVALVIAALEAPQEPADGEAPAELWPETTKPGDA